MKFEKIGNNIISGTAERDKERKIYINYIGIDPDVTESGFANYQKANKKLIDCTTLAFFDLYQILHNRVYIGCIDIVNIEGGWLNEKANFRLITGSKSAGERVAKNVGSNHAVGKLIVEMCIHLDISFVVRKPIKPIFKNEIYFKKITGWTGRTNADARSAANYVYGY